ncbi:hypothetical protein OH76DRAFT_1348031, partial [Lentinus brumalis]
MIRILHQVIEGFTLNIEQERAFLIIAETLHHRNRPPLRMYLGGMGGTGKSTVICATVDFLTRRAETHRFLIMAPTGSAAAQVAGSTYHSVLGFTKQNANHDKAASPTILAKVRDRIEAIDVFFYDEISMTSC